MKRLALVALILALIVGASWGGWALANDDGSEAEVPQTQVRAPGWLGITVDPIQKQLAWWLDMEGVNGVIILKVSPNSPADEAGLEPKDIIIAVNGLSFETPGQIIAALRGLKAGDEITLTILRNGAEQEITVVVSQRPGLLGLFPELQGIAPQEYFQHFLGGQFGFSDADGNVHTVQLTPGILEELGDDYVTITPNGQTEPKTFVIAEETIIMPPGLEAGSWVIVVCVDDLDQARAVLSPMAMAKLHQLRGGEQLWRCLPELKGQWQQHLQSRLSELKERLRKHMPWFGPKAQLFGPHRPPQEPPPPPEILEPNTV
ncbi:MAG TPA: PDZ domain-containing protein [Dehalococcoidia bacterium]|nr:PDZ domain-containing protein [Dehalococcoidia bacterium]